MPVKTNPPRGFPKQAGRKQTQKRTEQGNLPGAFFRLDNGCYGRMSTTETSLTLVPVGPVTIRPPTASRA